MGIGGRHAESEETMSLNLHMHRVTPLLPERDLDSHEAARLPVKNVRHTIESNRKADLLTSVAGMAALFGLGVMAWAGWLT